MIKSCHILVSLLFLLGLSCTNNKVSTIPGIIGNWCIADMDLGKDTADNLGLIVWAMSEKPLPKINISDKVAEMVDEEGSILQSSTYESYITNGKRYLRLQEGEVARVEKWENGIILDFFEKSSIKYTLRKCTE